MAGKQHTIGHSRYNAGICQLWGYLFFVNPLKPNLYNSIAVMDRIRLTVAKHNVTSCAVTDLSPDHLGDRILGTGESCT